MSTFKFSKYNSRRSDVLGLNGSVATSHPLAANAGLDILKKGGNAVDAAITAAAVLNVVEPMSTGIGGDVFSLLYLNDNSEVIALNGSGRSGSKVNYDYFIENNLDQIPSEGPNSGLSVSVPGAVDAWEELSKNYGNFSLDTLLTPAIDLANNGFSVSEVIADYWKKSEKKLLINDNCDFLINNKSPKFGDIFKNKYLGKVLKEIANNGKAFFYQGDTPKNIISYLNNFNGVLTEEDFYNHKSEWVEPISINYKGYDVWECPPNGQGIAALIALNIYENFTDLDNENLRLHYQIESTKIAFKDSLWHVSDPEFYKSPIDKLLSKQYASKRFDEIDPKIAKDEYKIGNLKTQGDTVYISVVDKDGNACSFINSLFQSFGSGLVIPNHGIAMNNRGSLFSLEKNHPNKLEPQKRPFNTIIPSLITKEKKLFSSLGVMGGFQQPQGHLQVISNMIDLNMTPQAALDAPRFNYDLSSGIVNLEESFEKDTYQQLSKSNHNIKVLKDYLRGTFGGGQVINKYQNTFISGSDPRKDGLASSY